MPMAILLRLDPRLELLHIVLAGMMTLGYDVDRRWGTGVSYYVYIWCAAQWEEPHGYSPTERRPVFIHIGRLCSFPPELRVRLIT